jgi:hypothetical protein
MKRDKSDTGKKALAKRAAAFGVLHPSGQAEHEPNLMEMSMDRVIVDPLHCLFLNLPKTMWKYSFGDRMTNHQREAVAEYLGSIGCALDIRAKGDGRDADMKWFTGAIFQRLMEGTKLGDEGGLKRNIEAIVDIIFRQLPADAGAPADADAPADTATPASAPASDPQSASAPTAKAPRARGRKRRGGFSAVGTDTPTEPPAEQPTDLPAEPPAYASSEERA